MDIRVWDVDGERGLCTRGHKGTPCTYLMLNLALKIKSVKKERTLRQEISHYSAPKYRDCIPNEVVAHSRSSEKYHFNKQGSIFKARLIFTVWL